MIFGLGAPVAVAAGPAPILGAALTEAVPRKTVLYGTVVQVDGSTLWLRTRTDMARVDVSAAESSGNGVTLIPGRAVEVVGRLERGGSVRAEWLDYPQDSPALWPADE